MLFEGSGMLLEVVLVESVERCCLFLFVGAWLVALDVGCFICEIIIFLIVSLFFLMGWVVLDGGIVLIVLLIFNNDAIFNLSGIIIKI